jgi:hypothetical protein
LTRKSAFPFSAVALFALAGLSLAAQAPEKPLTIDTIFAHGPLIGEPPDQLTWSPDGKHLTYLDGGELMDVDPATGKTHVLVSAAKMENLNGSNGSEKDRDHRQRYNLASYVWAPDSTHILFDSNGRMWLYDLRNGAGIEIGFSGLLSGDDPKFSPDGWSISFIKITAWPSFRFARQARRPFLSLPRPIHPPAMAKSCSMAKWTGCTKKSLTCAATTSGRRIQKRLPICR